VRAAWTRALDDADRFATGNYKITGDERFRQDAEELVRVREAFEKARTLDDLRRLSEGPLSSRFAWQRR
jgi:hypothetical protein